MDPAQRVLEDFQRKRRRSLSQLFLLAYDQVKAYDSVQAYTITASLERFNLPEKFICYVLSNLENATSCFKTFYGPTDDFPVVTSVRQGDPLTFASLMLCTKASVSIHSIAAGQVINSPTILILSSPPRVTLTTP